MGRSGTLGNALGVLWRALGALWGALERFGGFSFSRRSRKALWRARERSGTLWGCVGALWERSGVLRNALAALSRTLGNSEAFWRRSAAFHFERASRSNAKTGFCQGLEMTISLGIGAFRGALARSRTLWDALGVLGNALEALWGALEALWRLSLSRSGVL